MNFHKLSFSKIVPISNSSSPTERFQKHGSVCLGQLCQKIVSFGKADAADKGTFGHHKKISVV